MNRHRTLIAIALNIAALTLAPMAFAQEGPCAGDAQKFCKDVKPGGGRIAQCLKQHEADLSQACKDRQQKIKAELEKIHQACQGDVEKLCKNVEPGDGRIARCLKENQQQVSAQCKSTLEEAKSKREQTKKQ